MTEQILKNIFRFVLFVLLQVTLFNHTALHNLFNPFIYIFILILFPPNTPHPLLVILGCLVGLTVDYFSGTFGLHAFACATACYLRPYILRLIVTKGSYDEDALVSFTDLELIRFITYAAIFTLTHHLVLFYIENFSWNQIGFTFLKALFSSLLTLVFIVIIRLIFFKQRSR